MRPKALIGTLIACVGSFLIGITTTTVFHRSSQESSPTSNHVEQCFISLLAEREPGREADWSEYRRGNWHIAVAWVQDLKNQEARIYTFTKHATNAWSLVDDMKLPYSEEKLDHVHVDYLDRYVMLMNDQGVLIQSLSLSEGDLASLSAENLAPPL